MTKMLLPGCFLLFGAAGFGATCLPGNLQSYIALGAGGCELGAVQFSDFTTAPGQNFATPISPQSIQVTPGGTTFLPSLLFTLNSSATSGNVFESFFRFDVSGTLTSASALLNSPVALGDGAVTGILDVCAGGSFAGNGPVGCSASASTAVAFAINGDSALSGSVNFPATSFFDVFVDLTIDGGSAGSASLPSAAVSIGAVPEPSVALLIAAGLGIMGTLQMRRMRRR